MRTLLILIVLLTALTACNSQPTPDVEATVQAAVAATQTAQPADTVAPSPTSEPTGTATPTPIPPDTPTMVPTNTVTPPPTATPTSTATVTPSPSPTPLSREDYLNSVNPDLDYRTVEKTDRYLGERICWKGEVFNIEETDELSFVQAWYFSGRHYDNSGEAFVVSYPGPLPEVFNETEIMACGEIGEDYSGVNAFGGSISQPRIMARYVELWAPAPLPTPPPTNTPTPLPVVDDFGVQKQVGQWGLKLYDVKRAKAVYFFGDPEIAQGVWLLSFVEFTNLSSGTRNPWEDLDFYYVDEQGQIYEARYNDAWLGARWQFQAGDIMDDIQPGSILGVVLPIDSPENLGHIWLRVEQDPNFAIYLGKASDVPFE